jgi:hypothetical protein
MALGLAGLVPLVAEGKEEKIALDKVPAPVVKAEKAKWPQAQIVGIEREEEDGKTTFEFGLKQGQRKWDASFDPQGAIVAVEETIADKDVPAPVKKGLDKKYPKANVLLIEKVTEGEGKTAKVFYEYKIKTKDGGVEVKLDPAGKVVLEEQKKGDEINE